MSMVIRNDFTKDYIQQDEIQKIAPFVYLADDILTNATGAGSDFLGWVNLPTEFPTDELDRIATTGKKIIEQSDVVLVAGIGGSYLGARAAIEFICSPLYNNIPNKNTPDIYFVGNDLSPSHIEEVLSICDGRRVSVIVISKSGTTTETAVTFRTLLVYMRERYKENAAQRIFAITDKQRGTLRNLANNEGFESFVIEDNVGGRFSVLSPVGLLPIACAGVDVSKFMQGARDALKEFSVKEIEQNNCLKYVAMRNIFHRKGRSIEMYVGYDPCQLMFTEWLKQLFGESEGKNGKGIFPAGVQFTTDLHSMGQFIQDGSNILFETAIQIKSDKLTHKVAKLDGDLDGLSFLEGMELGEINATAATGVAMAHISGGTPTIVLEIPDRTEYTLGYMFYFFMKACAVSGYLLGVNPFDQPGVEDYKKNMFALLGKPGYEALAEKLKEKLRSNS